MHVHDRELPPSDADLIAAARADDPTAYGELFERHEQAIRRMAECLRGDHAEDLVLYAYTHGFDSVRGGTAPVATFRTFLLQAMLEHCLTRIEQTSDHLQTPFDLPVLRIFEGMPEDWQLVLWHSEVEQESPEQLALFLGVHVDDAWQAGRRARSAVRQFAVGQYLATTPPGQCRYAVDRLGGYANDELEPRDQNRVQGHLTACGNCTLLYGRLQAIDSRLPEILARGVLGPHAVRYLSESFESRPTGVARLVRLSRLGAFTSRVTRSRPARSRWARLPSLRVTSSVVLTIWGLGVLFAPVGDPPSRATFEGPRAQHDRPSGPTTDQTIPPTSSSRSSRPIEGSFSNAGGNPGPYAY